MMCPDCKTRLNCRDSRPTDAGMRRVYYCRKCDCKHYTIEIFREMCSPGQTVGQIRSQLEVSIRERVKRELAELLAKL